MRYRNHVLRMISAMLLVVAGNANAAAGANSPPWSKPMVTGEPFTIDGIENAPDLHGDVNDPQLVVFFAGNQYMLVNRLLEAFQHQYPKYTRVFAETLPPGVLVRQIKKGGIVVGNMRISLRPDVYTAGKGRIRAMQKKLGWFSKTEDYARNRLAIMTAAGNPTHITGWASLADPGLKLCMPNPTTEGIASHAIIPALRASGGDKLVDAVYRDKVKAGTTLLTHIHHRQTPIMIMDGQCTAGAVWYTEAYFHAHIAKHPLSMVEIPARQNHVVTYTAAAMKNAPHPEAAAAFLAFLASPDGQAIYRHYGFMAPKSGR
jgi:molybdate transport system substrate-binding protein